jgi:ketosteroid isomerase-like protein
MKKLKSKLVLVTFLFFGILPVAAQTSLTPSAKALAQLSKFRAEYVKGMLNKTTVFAENSYDENVRLMPAFQKTMFGKQNGILYHKAFMNRFNIDAFTKKEIEILDLGSQVIETGTLTAELVLKSTGEQFEVTGKYMDIWKELNNGEVALITAAWNYDERYDKLHPHLRFDDVPSVVAAMLPNVYVNNSIKFELAAYNRLLDAAVTEHDANVWCQYYADDSMLLSSYVPPTRGKKEIEAYFKMHVADLPVFEGLDIRNDHIDQLGNYIIEYASHIASWKKGESSGVGTGKNLRIWRRESDHSLKLFRSIGMYD